MEYRSDAGRRKLADVSSGACCRGGAALLGGGIRVGRSRRRHHVAEDRMAVRVFRWSPSSARYAVDSERVPESELWQSRQLAENTSNSDSQLRFHELFIGPYRRKTLTLLIMNTFGMFGWWGLFTWIPPYLSLHVDQGGRGFGALSTTT